MNTEQFAKEFAREIGFEYQSHKVSQESGVITVTMIGDDGHPFSEILTIDY